MLIFDETSTPYNVASLQDPVTAEYAWVLDLPMRDYRLSQISMVEEVVSPAVKLKIGKMEMYVPASWHILVYDRDTAQLDIVPMPELAGREFTALVYGPRKTAPSPMTISVVDYQPSYTHVGPVLHKHHMLCHPISRDTWVSIGPIDNYSKYLKNAIVGDLMS